MKNEETINLTVADLKRAYESVSCSTAKQVIKALKPEAFEEPVTRRAGDRFKMMGEEYILATVGQDLVCLISLTDGNRFRPPVKVKDKRNITGSEWLEISGTAYNFDKIKP